jgi:Flp pilus assembly protein TadG
MKNQYLQSILRRTLNDERGQVLPWTAFMIVSFLGMAGLVMDVGRAYYSFHELQASTDAAALASAESLPNTTATTVAQSFSSLSGNYNQQANMTNVAMVTGYPALKCLTTLTNEGIACSAPANANAVQVKQKAQVPTFFARLFGINYITISASATASMRGSTATPYNVAMIVDTTASMATTDSDSQCNSSRLTCALSGVQTLLSELYPCAAQVSSCGTATNGNVANPEDEVALFTFPNPTVGTVPVDYDCSSSNPTITTYSFPSATATSYSPATTPTTTPTYEVIPFSTDYKTSDTSSALNPNSNYVKAVGGKSGCTGMGDPGGESTYYAGVIYAAQAALVAEQASRPGSQNVIILVSDGDAEAKSTNMASGATSNGTYPSWVNECGQAITAAKAAASAGTHVYAVAYGAESSGCSTDTSGTYKGYTPCQVMQNIASAPQYFFSDYTQSGSSSSCISASQPTTNLNQIFVEIAGDLTVARLIPDSTT